MTLESNERTRKTENSCSQIFKAKLDSFGHLGFTSDPHIDLKFPWKK